MTTATIRQQVHAVTYRPRHAVKTPWWKADIVVLAVTHAGDIWDEAVQILAVFLATLIVGGIDCAVTFALWPVSRPLAVAVFSGMGGLIVMIIAKLRVPSDE